MAPPVSPRIKEKPSPRNNEISPTLIEEDAYAPPDEVALDPPTIKWFWGKYDLAKWMALPACRWLRKQGEWRPRRRRRWSALRARRLWPPRKRSRWSVGGRHIDMSSGWTKMARRMPWWPKARCASSMDGMILSTTRRGNQMQCQKVSQASNKNMGRFLNVIFLIAICMF